MRALRSALIVVLFLAVAPATSQAATQSREDPTDAPDGPFGRADLRKIVWDVAGGTAELSVTLDASTYDAGSKRADLGVHVLLDGDGDGLADHEVAATRDADAVRVNVVLRNLDRTLSTAECQDLDGKSAGAQATLTPAVEGGLESFTFAFDAALIPAAFRWAAFGQAPPDGADAGPWDVAPDAADPVPGAANPGDRRCNSAKSGVTVRMSQGVAFPDPEGKPPPSQTQTTPEPKPGPAPGPPPRPVVVLALPGGQPQAGTPATIDARGTIVAPGARVLAYQWDVDGDGRFDTNTGTNPVVHLMPGAGRQTISVTVIDSNRQTGVGSIALVPTGGPAACDGSEASIGVLRIRAACLRRSGRSTVADPEPSERYWSHYVVDINGIALVTEDADATITFDEEDSEIRGRGGSFRVMSLNAPGGDITWYESPPEGFTWPMPTNRRGTPHMINLTVENNCTGHESTVCAQVPGGFPVTGEIGIGIDAGTLDAVLDVQASVESGITVTGGVRLRTNLVLGGISLDSIRFSIEDATIGVVTLRRLAFAYEPPGTGEPVHEGDLWDVRVEVHLSSPPFRVAGRMRFVSGRLDYAGADVTFSPGIPIYAGVFLNRFAGGFGLGEPFRLSGGMGFSFASIIQVNVNWAIARFRNGITALRGDGEATIVGGELANFHMEFWSDGFFGFSGRLGYSYPGSDPSFRLFGQTDFWVEAQPGTERARYQGDGTLSVELGPVRSSARFFVNNDWAAGCFLLMKYVHSYRPGGRDLWAISPSCDVSEYEIQPNRPHEGILPPDRSARAASFTSPRGPRAFAAQASGRAVSVAAGQRALVLQVRGQGGSPQVALADPRGRVYSSTDTAFRVIADGAFSSAYLPRQDVTLLRVERPLAGEWTVTPRPGSVPIESITAAKTLPPVKLTARVSGSGRRRVLTWNASELAGRTIRFAERGPGAAKTIAVTKTERGSAPFALAGGSAGARSVEAQIAGADGVPIATSVVARFRSPGPPRPGRPGRLKARRTGENVVITWPRLAGARGFALRVRGSDGRREIRHATAGRRQVRILRVAPTTRLTVDVAGWTAAETVIGPRRTVVVRPAAPRRRR